VESGDIPVTHGAKLSSQETVTGKFKQGNLIGTQQSVHFYRRADMAWRMSLPPRGSTCGKVRHYSLEDAEHHMKLLEQSEQKNGKFKEGMLNVYRFDICDGRVWHVGHTNGEINAEYDDQSAPPLRRHMKRSDLSNAESKNRRLAT